MSTIAGRYDHFNNLLYSTKKRAVYDYLEHKAGRVPLDLSYKEPARTGEVITCDTSQYNGKHSDLLYKPYILKSTPNYGYDAGFDPTILNAVRYKYTDVSGLLIPPVNLPKNKSNMDTTTNPLFPYGIIH